MPGMPRNGIICTNSACLATGIMQHAVRLGIGRGHFGDQLVRRDADGTGDVVASRPPDRVSTLRWRWDCSHRSSAPETSI